MLLTFLECSIDLEICNGYDWHHIVFLIVFTRHILNPHQTSTTGIIWLDSLCFVTHLNSRLWWSTATLLGNEKWHIGLIIDISLWETGHRHLSSLKTIIPFKNVSDTFVPNCVFKCVFVCRAYLFCNFFILWDKLLKT